MKDEANRIENVLLAKELAERFRELGQLFHKYTSHSDEPLTALRGYVDEDLPWQAGSYLCDAFDRGILDSRSPQSESIGCDLRYLSPLWCRDRPKSLPPPKPRPKLNPNCISDGETIEGVRHLAEQCKIIPERDLRHADRNVRIISWWRFITTRLAASDRSRIRLGSTLDDHMPFLAVLDGKLLKLQPEIFYSEKRFSGDATDEKARYRLRTSARTQEVACEMLVELLESHAAIESTKLSANGLTGQGQQTVNSSSESGTDPEADRGQKFRGRAESRWPTSKYKHGPVDEVVAELTAVPAKTEDEPPADADSASGPEDDSISSYRVGADRVQPLAIPPSGVSGNTATVPSQPTPDQPEDTDEESEEGLPVKLRKLSPSRVKAKGIYDWAMSAIPNAEDMTIAELYDAIECHPSIPSDALAPNPEAFGKYLRDAGVKRYSKRTDKDGHHVPDSESI